MSRRSMCILVSCLISTVFGGCAASTPGKWADGPMEFCEACYFAAFRPSVQKQKSWVRMKARAFESYESDSEIRNRFFGSRIHTAISPTIFARYFRTSGTHTQVNGWLDTNEYVRDDFVFVGQAARLPVDYEENVCRFENRWVLLIAPEDINELRSGREFQISIRDRVNHDDAIVDEVMDERLGRLMRNTGFIRAAMQEGGVNKAKAIELEVSMPPTIRVESLQDTDADSLARMISADCRDFANVSETGGCIETFRASFDITSFTGTCSGVCIKFTLPGGENQIIQIEGNNLRNLYGTGTDEVSARINLIENVVLALLSEWNVAIGRLLALSGDYRLDEVDCDSIVYTAGAEPKEQDNEK
ncbi:MAG TPA: hypothetical protein PLY68_05670 [Myxococcota bacterium]|nr:hypothetical protein [Myxococcota bacterium]